MATNVDISILELVCSRLCHDLVGPVGAAANGIELLREMGNDPGDEVLDMTDGSARTAWRRLEFFRVAFGFGGGRSGWSTHELAGLARGMLADTRVTLDWEASDAIPEIEGPGSKMILNLVLLVAEAMPRGGVVRVDVQAIAGGCRAELVGNGPGATLNPRVRSAAMGQMAPHELDSRVILAHLAFVQAMAAGVTIEWTFDEDRVVANLTLPQPDVALAAE